MSSAAPIRASWRLNTAFTLAELLVVISLLALLSLLLVPALANSRSNTRATQCLNNLRQLAAAWQWYASDSDGRLVYNGESEPPNRIWVGGWLDFSSSSDNTNASLLMDHATCPNNAYLGPYVKTASVFRCPSDKSTVIIGGERRFRTRSVSMNWWVGAGTRTHFAETAPSPFQFYRKIDSIVIPTPAELWVILDEREDSIGGGSFMTDPGSVWNNGQLPATRHHSAAGLTFADGHSDMHRWTDPRTAALRPGQPLPIFPTDNPDIAWLQNHSTSRR